MSNRGWTRKPEGRSVWFSKAVPIHRQCVPCGTVRKFYAQVSPHYIALICEDCGQPYEPVTGELNWSDANCRHCAFPLVTHFLPNNPQPYDWWSAICLECNLAHDLPVSVAVTNRNAREVLADIERAADSRDANKHTIREPGWVYVMLDVVTSQVKVGGTSRSPEERWAEHPRGLLPLFARKCLDWRACERSAHEQLAAFRVSREEWFATKPDTAIQAVIRAVKYNFRNYNQVAPKRVAGKAAA